MPSFEELPEDVRTKLNEYRQNVEAAYESEFKVQDSKLMGARTVTRDQLADLAADAVMTLREVMSDSENDATRVKAATYVLDKVLGKDAVLDPEDPVAGLVERLTAEE